MVSQLRSNRLLLTAAVILLLLGLAVAVTSGPEVFRQAAPPEGELNERWLSNTGRNVTANHHTAIGGTFDGRGLVFAPVSSVPHAHSDGHEHAADHKGQGACALIAISGPDGQVRWRYAIPAVNCTIHSVADPTLDDVDGDGSPELLAATTERELTTFDPRTGRVLARFNLSTYGYTSPMVGDFTPANGREIVVTDVHGSVFVIRQNGTLAWSTDLGAFVWGQPAIDDFDNDGSSELVVALASGRLVSLTGAGVIQWNKSVPDESSVTWMTTGRPMPAEPPAIVIGSVGGHVALYDGADGTRRWTRDIGAYSAVGAFGDGDDDGTAEVYATARDGTLHAIDADTGEFEWTLTLTDTDVQMMPPPVMGDLTGDGRPELVAASNDGTVSVINPASGAVLADYKRAVPIWTGATIAEIGTGSPTILVMYGDGRVAALEFVPDRSS